MKVAIVHDYIREFGGAERVLKVLTEIFPEAPIYTAFKVKDSTAGKEFSNKKIIESWLAPILKIGNLYSPLRFLIPSIWGSFDLSDYDLVIVSSSWYITRGFKVGPQTKVVDYCHTPPRWLYGYETSVGLTKYWPVRLYAKIVGKFLRKYDFETAQKVDYFIANSANVAGRIQKFYKRDSTVIYPPVNVTEIEKATKNFKRENYFLIVSRLVGAKGLEEAVKLSKNLNFELRIVGEARGFAGMEKELMKESGGGIRLMGRVTDEELYELLGRAKGFIALARDEDFGMSVVEAQAAGTPVIAYHGGGFKESVIEGKTGIFIDEISEESLARAIKKLEENRWRREDLQKNAERFSREKFEKEIIDFIKIHVRENI